MTSNELRRKYLDFFAGKGHVIIPSAPLIPENDSSTLFISAGMQPLIPYLMGQEHPAGTRLVDCQKCIRTGDIDQVGDTFHHTFFEMLGNWSLGDYFKKESIAWSYQFLTEDLAMNPNRLWVSVFAGDNDAPRDEEAAKLWQKAGIPADQIMYLGKEDNWWAAGPMGPCGPDTEIFYQTDSGEKIEIWNNVFMIYNRKEDGTLEDLPKKSVDTGMGLERTLAVLNGLDDNYHTDLFKPLIDRIERDTGKKYHETLKLTKDFRIITDHIKASTFLVLEGVVPGNKGQEYVLRRLLRRAYVKMSLISGQPTEKLLRLFDIVLQIYSIARDKTDKKHQVLEAELVKFSKTLKQGLKELERIKNIDGKTAFDLYQSYGFPLELTQELVIEKGHKINPQQFQAEFEKHKELSRTASAGMFKGGLANQSEQSTKLHTATHLLHKALREVLGHHVSQKGSNITDERLRFDFAHSEKMSEVQIKEVEEMVNSRINEHLPVTIETMNKEQALASGAMAFFAEKYGDQVTVYSIGDWSKEICGGPHVQNTKEIGHFKITKEESVSSGIRRIYATVD